MPQQILPKIQEDSKYTNRIYVLRFPFIITNLDIYHISMDGKDKPKNVTTLLNVSRRHLWPIYEQFRKICLEHFRRNPVRLVGLTQSISWTSRAFLISQCIIEEEGHLKKLGVRLSGYKHDSFNRIYGDCKKKKCRDITSHYPKGSYTC